MKLHDEALLNQNQSLLGNEKYFFFVCGTNNQNLIAKPKELPNQMNSISNQSNTYDVPVIFAEERSGGEGAQKCFSMLELHLEIWRRRVPAREFRLVEFHGLHC